MEIEMILMRQLASYLTLPIFVVGTDGKLVYFNEAASVPLGRTFEEAGEMPLSDLSHIFQIMREDGSAYPADELPIAVALRERQPKHDVLRFRSLDGVEHVVQTTAFPLEGHGGRHIGAVAIFWDKDGHQ
jgi:PAS domain-containing protein